MDSPHIAGPFPPTGPQEGTYRIVWPVVGLPIEATVIGERIQGVVTHWMTAIEAPPKGRTVVCLDSECDLCRQGRRKRWLGYLAIWCHGSYKLRIMVLSRDSVGLLLRTDRIGAPLRGRSINAVRCGKDNSGPVLIGPGTHTPPNPFPAPPNILPSLVALYGPEVLTQIERARIEEDGL